jgi:hypothetical protein
MCNFLSVVQEDEELLKITLSPCKQLAVLQRIAEKQLLIAAIEYTKQRLRP